MLWISIFFGAQLYTTTVLQKGFCREFYTERYLQLVKGRYLWAPACPALDINAYHTLMHTALGEAYHQPPAELHSSFWAPVPGSHGLEELDCFYRAQDLNKSTNPFKPHEIFYFLSKLQNSCAFATKLLTCIRGLMNQASAIFQKNPVKTRTASAQHSSPSAHHFFSTFW